MRIIIEIDDKNEARVSHTGQTNTSETAPGSIIDSGGPNIPNQAESNGSYGGNGSTIKENTIDAGMVPSELLELMASSSTSQTSDQDSIDSGAAPNRL